jgi:hypothetical protein
LRSTPSRARRSQACRWAPATRAALPSSRADSLVDLGAELRAWLPRIQGHRARAAREKVVPARTTAAARGVPDAERGFSKG